MLLLGALVGTAETRTLTLHEALALALQQNPDMVIASWCGKKFKAPAVAARAGWSEIPAVRAGALHEIKSPIILQPGPAALTDGVRRMHEIIAAWAHGGEAGLPPEPRRQAVSSRKASR